CRRGIFGGVAIGLATVTAACVLVAFVTVAAAWIVGASLSTNPYIHATASIGPQTIALNYRYPTLASATDVSATALLSTDRRHDPDPILQALLTPAPSATFVPSDAAALSTRGFTQRTNDGLLSPHPLMAAHVDTMHGIAPAVDSAAVAGLTLPTRSASTST